MNGNPQDDRHEFEFVRRVRETHEVCLELLEAVDVLHEKLNLMKDVFIALSTRIYASNDKTVN